MTTETQKHTPGPFYVDHARPSGYEIEQIVVRAPERVNASTDVVAVVNGRDDPERRANANLFAAASELLEAGEAAISVLVVARRDASSRRQADTITWALSNLRAAIDKATP